MESVRSFRLLVIAALVALAIPLGVTMPGVYGDRDDRQYVVPQKTPQKYPNLDSMLNQLVARFETGGAPALEAASGAPLYLGDSVAVTFYLSGNVQVVVGFLEDNGGSARNVGEDYIEAYVPVAVLGPASDQAGVLRVQAIAPPHPGGSSRAAVEQAVPVEAPASGGVPVPATGNETSKSNCPVDD